jgi:hypothetical protein
MENPTKKIRFVKSHNLNLEEMKVHRSRETCGLIIRLKNWITSSSLRLRPLHKLQRKLLLIWLLIWVVALMGKVGDLVVSIYARWAKSKYHQESGRLCGEYRKRLAKRRQQADALMLQSKMEIPMVEALMACPLLKFIHFAANDCGYIGTRYKLIANWVHPLFLKAKSEASKEDNLSWKQAMNGPFKEEYWRAAVKEFETLKAMDAWEVVDRREAENVI